MFKKIKNSYLYRNFISFKKQLCCSHSHTFQQAIPEACWFSNGEPKGKHGQLILEGCYLCGKTWVRDYGA